MFRQIRWRIAVYYTVLIVAAMAGLSWYLVRTVRQSYLDDLRWALLSQARAAGEAAQTALARTDVEPDLDAIAKRYARLVGARLTLIDGTGRVLGDSDENFEFMDNHSDRPEVQEALAKGEGTAERFSHTTSQTMMYAAVRSTAGGAPPLVARAALYTTRIETAVSQLRRTVILATLGVALVTILLSLLLAETMARPLRQLTGLAQHISGGYLAERIVPNTSDEVGALAHAFNRMADRLGQSFTTLQGERERLMMILEQTANGVIVTDQDGLVTLINPAAGRILATPTDHAIGQTFAQVVRDHRLITGWQSCHSGEVEQAEVPDITLRNYSLRMLVKRVPATAPGRCLVILQDLTAMRRADVVRAEFVSNASHELRTPLAAMKALVETLRSGAIQDPPAAERFLNDLEAEVDNMSQLVVELLDLARIESGQARPLLAPIALRDAAVPVLERMQNMLDRAGLVVKTDLPAELPLVQADGARIQQVILNLMHNAIKFTDPGGAITLSAAQSGAEVTVSVTDTGAGIDRNVLPRIFERFFKADRARAELGTGLGLSIARHIVEAHGGRIWAESPVRPIGGTGGPGTRVSFTLKVAEAAS